MENFSMRNFETKFSYQIQQYAVIHLCDDEVCHQMIASHSYAEFSYWNDLAISKYIDFIYLSQSHLETESGWLSFLSYTSDAACLASNLICYYHFWILNLLDLHLDHQILSRSKYHSFLHCYFLAQLYHFFCQRSFHLIR